MKNALSNVVAVIRSYNNKHVVGQVRNLLSAGVGKIIVVTDGQKDNGSTGGWLSPLLGAGRVQLIEMHVGYSWSNALNIAIKAIQMANVRNKVEGKALLTHVLAVSVEAMFTAQHLAEMVFTALEDASIGVVGTTFVGKQDGNAVSLGRSYRHPRNTGMLIRLDIIGQVFGGFDARCDGIGGMEDIDFVLAMLALSTMRYEMLDLKVQLVVGNHYHQPTKEERERTAMDEIISHWRSLFPIGSFERGRIDAAINAMGIDH